jgi:hypothetical protein
MGGGRGCTKSVEAEQRTCAHSNTQDQAYHACSESRGRAFDVAGDLGTLQQGIMRWVLVGVREGCQSQTINVHTATHKIRLTSHALSPEQMVSSSMVSPYESKKHVSVGKRE